MTPPIDFFPLLDPFKQFIGSIPDNPDLTFQLELAAEARKRLRQVCTLLDAVDKYARVERSLRSRLTDSSGDKNLDTETLMESMFQAVEMLELFTECFYFIAWRLREILQLLPGLTKFDAPGVRTVRNQLIEHPDPEAQSHLPAFQIDDKVGPMLKPFLREGSPPIDRGLWINAEEFRSNFERVLFKELG